MNTTRRRLGALLAPLFALCLLASGAGTSALAADPDPAAARTVTMADFPTVKQIAKIYPFLRGGSPEISRAVALETYGSDCVNFARGYRASSVKYLTYLQRDGGVPYFEGREDPTFFVYEFATRAKAKKGFARLTSYAERCVGTHTEDDLTRTMRPVKVPKLGDAQVGFRTTSTYVGSSPAQEVEAYVLKGKRIERSWIQRDTKRIDSSHVVQMARALARTAR